MNRDERLNGDAVDLKPLIGLLDGIPATIIEIMTKDAIRDHRALVELAEARFNALPADIKAGKAAGGEAHIAYLDATIKMHAQMSALTTLLHVLGYTPEV